MFHNSKDRFMSILVTEIILFPTLAFLINFYRLVSFVTHKIMGKTIETTRSMIYVHNLNQKISY